MFVSKHGAGSGGNALLKRYTFTEQSIVVIIVMELDLAVLRVTIIIVLIYPIRN